MADVNRSTVADQKDIVPNLIDGYHTVHVKLKHFMGHSQLVDLQ